MKPTFIGIGGQKCASTWLAEVLRAHPEVYMCDMKETYFFTENYSKGVEWYESMFNKVKDEKQIGEFTSHYMYDKTLPLKIYNDLGYIKIIAILRNPYERFRSHYLHKLRAGKILYSNPLDLNIDKFEKIKIEHKDLIDNGYYFNVLKEYINIFGEENVKIILKDDIDEHPLNIIRETYTFLDVQSEYVPYVADKSVSKGIVPRFVVFEEIKRKIYCFSLEKCSWVIPFVKKIRLTELYRKLNSKKVCLHINPEVRKSLSSIYIEDIEKLENLLKRDLQLWKL